MTTSSGVRIIDHLVQAPNGQIVAIEVKSGLATRNAAQLVNDAALAREGGVIQGDVPLGLSRQLGPTRTIERRP